MTKLSPLYRSILCALAAGSVPLASAQEAPAKTKKIETISVTATKRTQNIQDTPLAVQAVSAENIIDQNIGNFDDFVRYMPNVT
ncbi:MAG: iron complex outermembrane receptor protein [Phenylobacterium sp.]|jgi:iron complex outermembrane receptor protein